MTHVANYLSEPRQPYSTCAVADSSYQLQLLVKYTYYGNQRL